MSVVFVPERLRGKAEVNQETLRRVTVLKIQLLLCFSSYRHQHTLHRNLIYLATIADSSPSPNAEKTVIE
ncbi:SS18-like protein 2 [Notechis scutatus]|uniref:SS18-like protein 2 n=1 Tax=Notechis scutatus TaxID=8663 RepID=A0A6J1VT89_9SAUR|nr:SS18-like protein 2 [Notechis scutatus]